MSVESQKEGNNITQFRVGDWVKHTTSEKMYWARGRWNDALVHPRKKVQIAEITEIGLKFLDEEFGFSETDTYNPACFKLIASKTKKRKKKKTTRSEPFSKRTFNKGDVVRLQKFSRAFKRQGEDIWTDLPSHMLDWKVRQYATVVLETGKGLYLEGGGWLGVVYNPDCFTKDFHPNDPDRVIKIETLKKKRHQRVIFWV